MDNSPTFSVLKVWLEPGEHVWAEPGALMLMKGDVRIETKAYGGILKALKRLVLGSEGFMMNRYEAVTEAELWFVPPTPGDIKALEIHDGASWIVQDTAYLAHTGEVDIDVKMRLRGVVAEGELFLLELKGEGLAWIASYGAIEEVEVPPGSKIIVDNYHFVAMPGDIDWRIRKFGGWKSFLLGGEGFVIEVRGPARLYVQTRILPFFAEVLQRFMPSRRA